MFLIVNSFGLLPVFKAYCSAGSPKASHPIGCKTSYPCSLLYLLIISVAVYPSKCPTCNPAPDGYGNISRIYAFLL
jgi:hypothetical protein